MINRLRTSDEHHQHPEHVNKHDPFASDEPSWFLKQSDHDPHEERVSRYRLSRNIPDRTTHPDTQKKPASRHSLPQRPRPPARFLESRDDADPSHEKHPVSKGLSLKQTFALAALMAVISGGTVGFLSSQYSTLKGTALALLSGAETTPAAEAPAIPQKELHIVTASVVPKKQVATATLEVNDVTGETNSLIPLLLSAEPALPSQDLIMKISGLPEDAYLTSGTRDADKVWALSMDDLRNVKLMIPQAQQPQFDVAVAAFEKNTGELAAPVKTMTIALSDVIVEPVSAPPPLQMSQPALSDTPRVGLPGSIPEPVNVSVTHTAARQMAAKHALTGDSLLKSGDLEGARKAYQQAWTGGSPDGALGMAKSYDPEILAALKVKDIEPNGAYALKWYQRAATAGKTEALSAIVRLRMKPE